MNDGHFIWKFNREASPLGSSLFPGEWVCRTDKMRAEPRHVCGKSIWLILADNRRSYLFGHMVAEKIERLKNGDKNGRYFFTADDRLSFRILPRRESEWDEWKLPRMESAGLSLANGAAAKTIGAMLAQNIKPFFSSRKKAAKKTISAHRGNIEAAYLRALRENSCGDLTWARSRDISPFAALFSSNRGELSEELRDMDGQILHVLKKGFCQRPTPRRAASVDTSLCPAEDSRMLPRKFVAGERVRAFPMEKTQAAENKHQAIARALRDFFIGRKISPMLTGSIDLAARIRGELWIFEIKSASQKNFESQARSGIIQILEYKMWMEQHESSAIRPALVISSISSSAREAYIKNLAEFAGVDIVFYNPPAQFSMLPKIIRDGGKAKI